MKILKLAFIPLGLTVIVAALTRCGGTTPSASDVTVFVARNNACIATALDEVRAITSRGDAGPSSIGVDAKTCQGEVLVDWCLEFKNEPICERDAGPVDAAGQ